MIQRLFPSDLNFILKHTELVWNELKASRLFITGGTGFFGKWLLEGLIWANQQLGLGLSMVVLTRNVNAFIKQSPHLANNSAVKLLQGDIIDFNFPNEYFSHVIHGATEASAALNQQNPQLMLKTIVKGTSNTLEFVSRVQPKKLLYISSGAVYGKQPPKIEHLQEDCRNFLDYTKSDSAHETGKQEAEKLCLLHAEQSPTEVKIARCFAFVGPYLPLDKHFAIGNFIRDSLFGNKIYINSDGKPCRSYMYAADLVIWLLNILCRGESCVPYNVGSDESITILDLAKKIANQFQPLPQIEIAYAPQHKQFYDRYIPCIQRAKKLGLTVRVSLDQAIQKTVYWHQYHNNIEKTRL